MWKAVKPILASLFSSKKFLALLAGLIVWLAAKAGLEITQADTLELLLPLSAYILGQGIADHGKEAAKVNAVTAKELQASATKAKPKSKKA